jgi:hypothetical protein
MGIDFFTIAIICIKINAPFRTRFTIKLFFRLAVNPFLIKV